MLFRSYLAEAFRLLAENVPHAAARYSFVGLALANLFGWSEAGWTAAHNYMWIVHVIISFGFIAYIPYGKFFHFMAAPVVMGLNAADERR